MNSRHYQQYLTELNWRKDLDEINKVFLKSRAKSKAGFWIQYFAAVVNLKKENDLKIADSLAKIALKRFPTNEKIKALGKYDGVIIRNLETGERFGFNEKLQQEKQSELGTEFNQIIEETKGIAADKEYSEAQGRNIGRKANKLKIFD